MERCFVRTAKIVIEIIFKKSNVPKERLEEAVMRLGDRKGEFLSEFADLDADMDCRVFFERYGMSHRISLIDTVNDSRILRRLTGGKPNVHPFKA
jgi:hypothetical protein